MTLMTKEHRDGLMKVNKMEKTFEESNTEVYKGMYESYKKMIKRMIKSLPKSELIKMLQEMKIISKYKYNDKTYDLLNKGKILKEKEKWDY